jgi:hypothetical protein
MGPKRRKILKLKEMKEIGLDENKIQFLFILDTQNFELYNRLLTEFKNPNVEINIFTDLSDYEKSEVFNYFSTDLDTLFEICDTSFMMNDARVLSYDYTIIDNINKLNELKLKKIPQIDDEVCIVLAHCDSKEKKEILIENLSILKKQNKKIILSSHITVDEDVLEKVDYFVCDKKNDMISHTELDGKGATFQYYYYPGYHHELYYDNHAFAVLKLMLEGVILAKNKGYKISHLIHYDSVLYDFHLLNYNYNQLYEFDIIHYFFPGYEHRMDGNFLSIKTDVFLDIFEKINTKSEFVKHGLAMFEEFLAKVCYEKEYKIKSSNIENLFYKNIIDKIKMLDIGIKKYYSDEIVTQTFVIASKDEVNKYLSFTTEDPSIDYFLINYKPFSLEINNVTVVKIKDELWNNLIIEIPQLTHKQVIKSQRDVKFADCYLCNPNLINFYELTY